MAAATEQEVIENLDRPSQISWGAVFAGLVFVVAASWLLFMLGSAIGVGIADVTDAEALGDGLGIGVIVWLLLTSLIVYFIGALLAGRLSGKTEPASGMLHGLTVWSVGTALMVVLGYFGVSGLIQTGQNLVQSAASAVATMGSGAVAGAGAVGDAAQNLANSSIGAKIQAQLKKSATTILADSAGPGVDRQEIKQAVGQIEASTLQTATGQLITGDVDAARETLASETTLTEEQINAVVDGVAEDAKAMIEKASQGGDARRDPTLFSDIQKRFNEAASEFVAGADAAGGPEVSPQDISQAVSQLNPQTLQAVAMHLIRGDAESAKNTLVVNTDLSEAQINDIVDGVSAEVQQQVDEFQAAAGEQIETASTYVQAVLWAVFISSALGLAVSLIGGAMGADTLSRVQVARTRVAVAR